MKYILPCLMPLAMLVAVSRAEAQSAEETAALLYDGISDAKTNNPHEGRERISENPLTFRRWDNEGKTEYTDLSFEQIDGCRFRVIWSSSSDTSYKLVEIADFSKTYYPSTLDEATTAIRENPSGIYRAYWYPGSSCFIHQDGSSKCNTDIGGPGISLELPRILAAVKYMKENFCKMRAY